MTKKRIVIVDDHPFFRQGLRDVLDMDAGLEVIGEAPNGATALKMVEGQHPDVVLMDINLPDIMGLQVTKKIKALRNDVKVIVITGYSDLEQSFHAIRSGASAYCMKDITPEKLVDTIYSVSEGYYVVNERVMTEEEVLEWIEETVGRVAEKITTDREDSFIPLSPREMEILQYVTHGRSNKEIAFELGISHQTVKNHMTAILRKMNVDDRTQAAVYALSRGWVRLEHPFKSQSRP